MMNSQSLIGQKKIKKALFLLFFMSAISPSIAQEVKKDTLKYTNIEAFYKDVSPSKVKLAYETEEEYSERMQWWKDAKYGMFIHWGLYSVLAGDYLDETTPRIAEWIQRTLKIPLKEYRKLMEKFKAEKFDADAWAQLAKDAGMKYVVLTSKHHDGFALFDSKASDYNVMNTGHKKDIVKQLKEACHRKGLKFGLYYSHVIDWEHPHAYIGEGRLASRMNDVDFDVHKMDRAIYLKEKAFPQLKEILTNYGTIDLLWFDMGSGLYNDETREFVKITKQLQPNIIISSRVGSETSPKRVSREMLFDYFTPSDNYFTGDDLDIPWEMAGTTNHSWGYRSNDEKWRTPFQILNSLIGSNSRGGNYLLNVGPKENGIIPVKAVENLKKVGKWLDINKEAVYETTSSPFPWNYPWGYCTQKPNKIFLHVFNAPKNNTITLNGLLTKVDRVYRLDTHKNVAFKQEGRFLTIPFSNFNKKELATVFVVEYKDEELKIDKKIHQNLDKTIRLDRIAGTYLKDVSFSTWSFKVDTPGIYKINIVSNEKGNHSKPTWVGSEQEGSLTVAGKTFPIALKRDSEAINPSLFFFKSITSTVGEIEFNKPGTYTLHLKGIKIGAGKWQDGLGLDRVDLERKKH